MALTRIKTGEMIRLCSYWSSMKEVFERNELLAPLYGYVERIHGELASAWQPEPPPDERERAETSLALRSLDRRFDTICRNLYHALDLLGSLIPERADDYAKARALLFPDGLEVVKSSYDNEAGEIEAMHARLESAPEVKALLTETVVHGKRLMDLFEELVDVRARMAPLLDRLSLPKPSTREQVLTEFSARRRWMKLVRAIRAMVLLQPVPEEDARLLLDKLDAISAARPLATRPGPESPEDDQA